MTRIFAILFAGGCASGLFVLRGAAQDNYAPVPYDSGSNSSQQTRKPRSHSRQPSYYGEEETLISEIGGAIRDKIQDTVLDYATQALDKLNFWIFTGKSYDDQNEDVKFDHDAYGLITLDRDKATDFLDIHALEPTDQDIANDFDEGGHVSPPSGENDENGSE
jgi:hypothetical protein